MDWSKIKTIFILTFLILDVYLLYQFLSITDTNKYEFITEASTEDKLKADEIKYVDMPKVPLKDQYISAKTKTFKQADTEKLEGQTVTLLEEDKEIYSKFKNPLQLPDKIQPSDVDAFLKDNILYPEHYQFGKLDRDKREIIYYQVFEGRPFYENDSAMVKLTFNDKNQIISYEQTYLESIEKMKHKEEIQQALEAMETLHKQGLLKAKSKVTKVELGYSTLIPLAASQVMAPTWHFVVDDKKSLYVNGFEGQVIDLTAKKKM